MKSKIGFFPLFFLFLQWENCIVGSSKILVLSPISSISEANFFQAIARELHSRGHEITYVAPSKAKFDNVTAAKTFHQLSPVSPTELSEMVESNDLKEQRIFGRSQFTLKYDPTFIFKRCHATFQNKEFQDMIVNKKKGDFDLIISYGYVSNCFDGLLHKFGAPFIIVSPLPVPSWIASLSGFFQPTSFVPVSVTTFSDKMTFFERILNSLIALYFGLSDEYVMQTKYTNIYRKYLGNDVPHALEIRKDVSLILSNSHFSMNFPRPILPDIVEIGGFHCKPAKPLPKELNDFVSGGKDGFIYFSLGTFAKSTNMDEHTKRIFINVFSRLKQRVVWKFENESMANIPSNLKISKWLPQQDILGHPNIRLFIMHGGLFSAQESVYHGVPMISLPIVGDQDVNSNNLVRMGNGLTLEILDLTEEKLETAIHKVLNNPKYAKNARKSSAIFKDQPMKPVEKGIYWIEYVMKHKGAVHLRSAARDLSYIQQYCLDIIIFLMFSVVAFIYLVAFLIKKYRGKGNDAEDFKYYINKHFIKVKDVIYCTVKPIFEHLKKMMKNFQDKNSTPTKSKNKDVKDDTITKAHSNGETSVRNRKN